MSDDMDDEDQWELAPPLTEDPKAPESIDLNSLTAGSLREENFTEVFSMLASAEERHPNPG